VQQAAFCRTVNLSALDVCCKRVFDERHSVGQQRMMVPSLSWQSARVLGLLRVAF